MSKMSNWFFSIGAILSFLFGLMYMASFQPNLEHVRVSAWQIFDFVVISYVLGAFLKTMENNK